MGNDDDDHHIGGCNDMVMMTLALVMLVIKV